MDKGPCFIECKRWCRIPCIRIPSINIYQQYVYMMGVKEFLRWEASEYPMKVPICLIVRLVLVGTFLYNKNRFLSFCQALLFWQRSVSKGFEILYCLMLFVKYCRPTDSTQELWNYIIDPIPRQWFIMDVRFLVCIPHVFHVFHWFPMRLRHVWGSWLLPWGFVVFFFPLNKIKLETCLNRELPSRSNSPYSQKSEFLHPRIYAKTWLFRIEGIDGIWCFSTSGVDAPTLVFTRWD